MKYCTKCGAELEDEVVICPKCGCYADKGANQKTKVVDPNASDKSRLIDILLCAFIGGLGVHCFYEGKIGKGILYIFTAGLFGIGTLIDLIMIACGDATDKEGKIISDWNLN